MEIIHNTVKNDTNLYLFNIDQEDTLRYKMKKAMARFKHHRSML